MAYSPKGVMDIYQILSRWHAGYSIKRISRSLQVDRKTVRRYIRAATNKGLSRDEPLPEREVLLGLIEPLLPKNDRATPARSQFEPYREEILDLVTRSTDSLKAETAYQVICHRYGVRASYSSFKRFFRTLPTGSSPRTTSRVEVAPAAEIQIDYAKVGTASWILIRAVNAPSMPSSERSHTAGTSLSSLSIQAGSAQLYLLPCSDVRVLWRRLYLYRYR